MRATIAMVALLGAVAAGCSSASSGGSPTPRPTPTPTPTYTQLGTLAISQVLGTRPYHPGARCPQPLQAFPHAFIVSGEKVKCDGSEGLVLLLAPPAIDQTDVDAATVGRDANGVGWSVDLQLSRSGADKLFALTQQAYEATGSGSTGFGTCAPPTGCNAIAIIFDGAVTNVPSIEVDGIRGGLVQMAALSKQKASQIAAALNPS